MTIYIAIEMSTIVRNRLDQLLSYEFVGDAASWWSIFKYKACHSMPMYIKLLPTCIYIYIFAAHRLECQGLKYILEFINIMFQIMYVVSYRHKFPMHWQWDYRIVHWQELCYINSNIHIISIRLPSIMSTK